MSTYPSIPDDFTWTSNSWDTLYPIVWYVNSSETDENALYTDLKPRLSYMLYDNPTDWETFKLYY